MPFGDGLGCEKIMLLLLHELLPIMCLGEKSVNNAGDYNDAEK
jgi:hypothetical protein